MGGGGRWWEVSVEGEGRKGGGDVRWMGRGCGERGVVRGEGEMRGE